MSKKVKTHVAIILDKSGSMASTKSAAIAGFNEQVQQMKINAQTQDILCSLVTFNGEVFEHLWNVPVEKLEEASESDFMPCGSTAMMDAVGYVTQKLIDTTDYNDPDTAYLIITISDGETNADRHYDKKILKELVQKCESSNKWTYTYMGCGKEYLEKVAEMTGTSVSNMAAWDNSNSESVKKSFRNSVARSGKYFSERELGSFSTKGFASDNDAVADYSVGLASSEVNLNSMVSQAKEAKFDEIQSKIPKYVATESPVYTGGSLLRNAAAVKWEK